MKVVLLAGGYGTRLGQLSGVLPKPMVGIGNRPIIWHIMKCYAHYGFKEFIVSAGYKADVIKEYFFNYRMHTSDFTVDLGSGNVDLLSAGRSEDWRVTIIDTGVNTLKGARLKRIEQHLDDVNMVTYGDGVADVNISKLLQYHQQHRRLLTITGVHPPARFGELETDGATLIAFREKPQASVGLINGGFMVFNRALLEYLTPDEGCDLEGEAIARLVEDDQVRVFRHNGNWECVDHERDLQHLNQLWSSGRAFWKVW
jgi:glucose-1-phosphate cytidylyltransferase